MQFIRIYYKLYLIFTLNFIIHELSRYNSWLYLPPLLRGYPLKPTGSNGSGLFLFCVVAYTVFMFTSIVWFRNDLRTADNPALAHAGQHSRIVPIYIWDKDDPRPMGAAARWWLNESLASLQSSGVPLLFAQGSPIKILRDLQKKTRAQGIYWNRCYDIYSRERDHKIKESLENCHSFNGSLLFEPWEITNKKGAFFKVFTPYWKACLATRNAHVPLKEHNITYVHDIDFGTSLEALELYTGKPDWAQDFKKKWVPGEKSAQTVLETFLSHTIATYDEDRKYPNLNGTSHLSPHLRFGEISPQQIWTAVRHLSMSHNAGVICYLSELGWREFSYHLLYYFPALPTDPFREKFLQMPWSSNENWLTAWKKGETGYPIVDAGMRELWALGFMHNRLRMIVASFLTKHCLISWQDGENWFWDTLVDADCASNAAGWQWVAGCGADSSPYFRVLNPVLQSKKFDKEGIYIKTWVPELRGFSSKDIHAPHITSLATQESAQCIIGKHYPHPIVNIEDGRHKAFAAYQLIKKI